MAKVYSRVNGMKLHKLIAMHEDTQAGLMDVTLDVAARAKIYLSQHRDKGDSYIEVESGQIDRYVTLNDERGFSAALSIEEGTERMEGTHVLKRATHLRAD